MSATEVLRRMLDERGVEWREHEAPATDCVAIFDGEGWHDCWESVGGEVNVTFSMTPEQAIEAAFGRGVTGETSDGYHTFDELYHHRAVLFSVIVRMMPDKAWKSRLHHDGTMYDGMFIVGIDTPAGQATYHYDIDPYWGMFDCEELERAPEWDGHTPSQAIERIATLGRGECHVDETETVICGYKGRGNTVFGRDFVIHVMECSACGRTYEYVNGSYEYCPHCGRRVKEVE